MSGIDPRYGAETPGEFERQIALAFLLDERGVDFHGPPEVLASRVQFPLEEMSMATILEAHCQDDYQRPSLSLFGEPSSYDGVDDFLRVAHRDVQFHFGRANRAAILLKRYPIISSWF